MNNSKLAQDFVTRGVELGGENDVAILRRKAQQLSELIDAVDHIRASEYWHIIAERKFAPDLVKLISQLKKETNPVKLYSLQGQIIQAERLDLDATANSLRNDLMGIRKQIDARERGTDS